MKTYLYNLISSALLLIITLFLSGYSYVPVKGSYVTLAPSLTEIVYAIGAEDNLSAVTLRCNYPDKALSKPKIGDAFFINKEAIIKKKPEMILALISQKPLVDDLKLLGIKIHYFSFQNFNDVYNAILEIGQITSHQNNARVFASKLKSRENSFITRKRKNVLYVAQPEPLITIGRQSYMTDIILKSGHNSITSSINGEYPKITLEYVLSKKPDVVIVYDSSAAVYLKQFLKSKFIVLSKEQRDIINRPGPRILDAIKIFSSF